jgi:threonine dehydrogenase-like Zn-dependent dehydrogenase
MKALIFDGQARLASGLPVPDPAPGEARIRMLLAGICNTDLEIVRGYAGFQGILGHEFVGVVDSTEDQALAGRRVVGAINIGCGSCRFCRAGMPEHCLSRQAVGIRGRDGALAEFFCLPAANLLPVPDSVPDRAAVFAEPLAAACSVLARVHVRPADRVLVLGDGKLGLLAAQVLAHTGCNLTAVGRHEENLAILAARGIDTRMDDAAEDGMADVVVDCSGTPSGFQAAQRLVRPRGTIVLKSTYHGPVQADLSQLVVDEIRLVGSRCGPMDAALRLLADQRIDVIPLIHAEYSIDDAELALEHAARPGTLKVLVRGAAAD